MKLRMILTAAVACLCAASVEAGPLRNAACRVKQRVQSRPHVRQAACDVRTVAHAVASIPSRVIEARPLRTFAGNVVQAFVPCPSGVCR